MEFIHWVTVYNGVLTNLYGKDREEAIAVMDDDKKFDQWMARYERKIRSEALDAGSSGGSRSRPKRTGGMSREEYLSKFGNVVGG